MRRSVFTCLITGASLAIVLTGARVQTVGTDGGSRIGAGEVSSVDLSRGGQGPVDSGDGREPVVVEASSAERLVLALGVSELRLSTVELSDGHAYTRATARGSTFVGVGKPAVPAFGSWILIPIGTRAVVEVDAGEPVVMRDLGLEPVQPPRGELEDAPEPPFARDETVFGTDAHFPGEFARLEPTKIMRGQPCTVLWLYPVQYNPVQRTLSAYPDLRVTIRFEGEVGPLRPGLQDPGFENAQRQLAVNADAVLDAQSRAGKAAEKALDMVADPGGRQTGWDYLIFSRAEFAAAGDLLASWKRKIGHRVYHQWLSSTPTAAGLKGVIQSFYDNLDIPPRYLLIIGDADDIRCFYETEHPYEDYPQAEGTQGYVGTDLYYATLDGPDEVPDLAYGRMSVENEAQAMAWVERIIAYEQDPPTLTNFYDNVALAAYFQESIYQDGKEDMRFTQTSEDLAKFFSEAQYGLSKTANRIYSAEPGVWPTNWSTGQHYTPLPFGGGPAGEPNDPIPAYLAKPGFAWDGDADDITAALEPGGGTSGSFLLVHLDHGERQYWVHPYFHSFHLLSLDITFGESPVVWSVNCQTGWFDNETDFPYTTPDPDWATGTTEECFAEFFTYACSTGGPVGVVASSRVSENIYNDRLVWGMVDAIWPSFVAGHPPIEIGPTYRMGDVLNFAKSYLMVVTPDTDWRLTHLEEYHWFGDPAMEIRTEHPDWLTATCPTMWPYQGVAHDLMVHVENNSGPVNHARVTLSHPDEFYQHWTASTDASGNATFSALVTSETGSYDLVVTASNNVPWIGTVFSGGAGLIFIDGFESGNTSAW